MKSPETKSLNVHWLSAWHVNPSVNKDYDFIDGLRGVAILMVMFCHNFYVNPESASTFQFLRQVALACGNGVTLFFALSGFLISWPFWKRKLNRAPQVVPPGYGWRRFWKIYPPLALSIAVFTPIYIFRNHDWSYIPIAASWLAGIPFILPVSGKINPVMWTLVVEVQFYMVLPLTFLIFRQISLKNCLWLMTLLFLAVPILAQIITGHTAAFFPDINVYFPTALCNFYFGILIAGLDNLGVLNKKWASLGDVGLILLPLTLIVIGWLTFRHDALSLEFSKMAEWLVKIAAGCLLCYVADPQNPRVQLLCTPWLRWCGIISYEWYLFHQPIILWSRLSFGPAHGSVFKYIAIVGGAFLVGLITAALSYRFFSLPILKYGRSRGGR